jgi:hypothetical protein
MTPVNYANVVCKVCNQPGGIGASKLRRFSGPVVAIGYIFLVPSVLGMLFGVLMLFGTCSAAHKMGGQSAESFNSAIESIQGITRPQVSFLEGAATEPTSAELVRMGLNENQAEGVGAAWRARSAGEAGAGIGAGLAGGFAIFMVVSSFVGGLLGWILTMKRNVLLCRLCNGVHAEAA